MLDLLQAVFKYKQKRSPDQLGLYPEAVHVNAIPERRYLWSSRLLVIFACLSICFNLMLVSTIYVMLPQRGANPRIFTVDEDTDALRMLPALEVKTQPKELLNEYFVREYVLARHRIYANRSLTRLNQMVGSKLYWMSSSDVYNRVKVENPEVSNYPIGMRREVDIKWVRPISMGAWQVRFATLDYYPNVSLPQISFWQAYLRTAFALVDYDNKYTRENNPTGFVVYC